MIALGLFACAATLLGSPVGQGGSIVLDPLLQHHMVLQRGTVLAVRGTARDARRVDVEFADATAHAEVREGAFEVQLPALEAGGPFTLRVVADDGGAAELHDVLVGDVWIVGGQSNAVWPLSQTEDPAGALARGRPEKVRGMAVAMQTTDAPAPFRGGAWDRLEAPFARGFSSLAFHFANELHRRTGVPQGVVVVGVGDSNAQSWVSRRALENHPLLVGRVREYERAVAEQPRLEAEYRAALAAFEARRRAAAAAGREIPNRPPRPPMGPTNFKRPWCLREGMLAPVSPYRVRGVVWYQGESDANRVEEYEELLTLLIADWRDALAAPELPFFIVQVPAIGSPADRTPGNWARLREVQRRVAMADPRAGLVAALDLGAGADLHPPKKREIAERLADLAMRVLSGGPPGAAGPVPASYAREGDDWVVEFDEVSGELVLSHGAPGFEVLGEDGLWHPASARASGARVHVRSAVPSVAVRYAWHDGADATLRDGAGRVATPFTNDPRAVEAPR